MKLEGKYFNFLPIWENKLTEKFLLPDDPDRHFCFSYLSRIINTATWRPSNVKEARI